MKIVLWLVVAVLAVFWTAGAALTAGVTQWAAQLIASGQAADLGAQAAQWPVPAWLALWVDPAVVRMGQEAVLWTLQSFRETLPFLGATLGWLVPVVWVFWGLGLLLLLLLAAGGHVLIGRFSGPRQPRLA